MFPDSNQIQEISRMNLHEQSAKGTRAQQLIESDIYRDGIKGVRQAILDTWSSSPIRDVEGQHELRLMLKLLDDLEGHIVSMVNSGKLANVQIEQESKMKEMMKRASQGLSSLVGR